MKALIQLGCLMFIFVLFSSCEPKYTYLSKEVEGEFVEAEIDGQLYRFTRHSPNSGYDFYASVIQISNVTIIQDQLLIGTYSEDGTKNMSIRVFNLWLDDSDLPLSVPIDLDGLTDPRATLTFQNDLTFNSENRAGVGRVQLTIEEWDSEDYLIGTFEGEISPETGIIQVVENGNFRIKVVK